MANSHSTGFADSIFRDLRCDGDEWIAKRGASSAVILDRLREATAAC